MTGPTRAPGAAEFALLCACCAWPPTPQRSERVRAAAAGVDWQRVASMARRHRVEGLVGYALQAAGVPVPRPIAAAAQAVARRSLIQCAEALRIQSVFAAAGIPVLFLKGAALAQIAYGSIAVRHSNDVDVVVPPGDVHAAWAALDEAGYAQQRPAASMPPGALRAFMRASKHSTHVHRRSGVLLELHWRITETDLAITLPPRQAWCAVEVAPGETLSTLGRNDLLPYLCVHGAADAWFRLKWVADIGAMLSSGDDHSDELWHRAEAAGTDPCAAAALILSHELLGTALPPGFVPPHSARLRLLLALSRWVMAPRDGDPEVSDMPWRTPVRVIAALLCARGWRARAGVISRFAVPARHIEILRLPAGLAFLYPLARVPLWLWKRSPAFLRK